MARARLTPERFAPGMARQLERLRAALADGMPRRGWKIGINVPEVLRRLELTHPGVGWIDGHAVVPAGALLRPGPDTRLHVEPEVAIRLAREVAPGVSADAARGCIDALHPALEVVDYGRPAAGLDDAVADCMFHHGTVLGAPAAPDAAADLGVRWPRLRVGEVGAGPPRADLVPSDLGELVAFVADFLAVFGQTLAPGDLILSGAYTAKAVPLVAGAEVVARFGPLGDVSARVAA